MIKSCSELMREEMLKEIRTEEERIEVENSPEYILAEAIENAKLNIKIRLNEYVARKIKEFSEKQSKNEEVEEKVISEVTEEIKNNVYEIIKNNLRNRKNNIYAELLREELEKVLDLKEQTHEAIMEVAGKAFERTPEGGVIVVDEGFRELWKRLNSNYVLLLTQEKELKEALNYESTRTKN